mmetsp:Transcript_2821/g.7973  ORF Transcript_2821/g.7973 Transcript_2821/m.7973 type:complete len:246 (+) Transcript_2821:666-1403(+)
MAQLLGMAPVVPLEVPALHELREDERGCVIDASAKEHHEIRVPELREEADLPNELLLGGSEGLSCRLPRAHLRQRALQLPARVVLQKVARAFANNGRASPCRQVDDALERLAQLLSNLDLRQGDGPRLVLRMVLHVRDLAPLRAGVRKDLDDLLMAVPRRLGGCGVTEAVPVIDLRPGLQQPTHHVRVPVRGRDGEGGAPIVVHSVRVRAIFVQVLHQLQRAGGRRAAQRCARPPARCIALRRGP